MTSFPRFLHVALQVAVGLTVAMASTSPMADDECPCPNSTYYATNCSCSTQITTDSGYPVSGECEFDDPECGADILTCEWKGSVVIMCSGQPAIAKPFFLDSDCGGFPTVRMFVCTGGTGNIFLRLDCINCWD